MTLAALCIVGYTVHAQTGWSDWDILMAWSLFLICYFGSCRVGDLLLLRVNTATDKVLLWSDIAFDQSGDRAVIYLRSPKTSVGNKGQSVILSKNPEAKFCPFCHLQNLRKWSNVQGPVFIYDSGKFLTPQTTNRILRQASILTGVPWRDFLKPKLELPVGGDLILRRHTCAVSWSRPKT